HMDYGFELTDDERRAFNEFVGDYASVLDRRSGRWQSLNQSELQSRSGKLKRFIRKGIPRELRSDVWMLVSGAQGRLNERPGYYKTLLGNVAEDDAVANQVRLDLHRTFPENVHFKEFGNSESQMQALFNVLYAFGKKNPAVGYCQGLNYVTALMLLVVKDEEKAFWLLDTLVNRILPGYYQPSMASFQAECYVLGRLVQEKLPQVHKFMKDYGVTFPMVTLKWFICLYADVLPVETVYRIWDVLFFEGSKVLFRVALTLIHLNQNALLGCRDLPSAIKVFQQMVQDRNVLHCHTFIPQIFKVPQSLPMKKIEQLRAEAQANQD
ncbi:hypothetical protein BOX15_Mlig016268g1, partial [Macrostomum lignano]